MASDSVRRGGGSVREEIQGPQTQAPFPSNAQDVWLVGIGDRTARLPRSHGRNRLIKGCRHRTDASKGLHDMDDIGHAGRCALKAHIVSSAICAQTPPTDARMLRT